MPRRRRHIPLNVFLNGLLVGQLNREATGAIDFRYDPSWLVGSMPCPCHCRCRCGRTGISANLSSRCSTTCCRTAIPFAGASPSASMLRERTHIVY
jgi:hypothetical protein